MHRVRVVLLVLLPLLIAGCFKTSATSRIAADGSAATRIVIELDLGFFEDLFGEMTDGFADEFGGEFGGESVETPSMSDQFQESVDELQNEMEAFYAENPDMRDRLQVRASLEDDVFRMELAVVTENVEQLAALYNGILGTGDGDLSDVFGEDVPNFSAATEEVGGGTGVFSDIEMTMADGEFSFRAETPATGEFDDDLELDFGMFDDLAPEINITITAPGDVIDTNGRTDGRTVSWKLDGTENEALQLRSEIDPSATIDGLDAIGSTGDDSGFPVALVVVLALIGAGVGAFFFLRSRTTGPGSDPTSGPSGDIPSAGAAPATDSAGTMPTSPPPPPET